MGVTHVVRGDDHLINAGRQTQIYQALGWDVPDWAHVPLIHGPDGKKLSKRHGALGVEAYRDMGYLPGGLRNYLLKLGWSHGDEELFFDDSAIDVFTLGGINSSPARLDFDKMGYINAQHMQREDTESLLTQAKPFLDAKNDGPLSDTEITRITTAMDSLKMRSQTFEDLASQANYLMMKRPLEFPNKVTKVFSKTGALDHLKALTFELNTLEEPEWTAETVQTILSNYAASQEIGFGKIGQPVRAALTAGEPSPDLALVLAFLGKDETLRRIEDILSRYED